MMARKPMVTRTITTTKCNVLCLDIETAEPCNISVTIPRTYEEEDKALKVVKSMVETDTLKAVKIVDTEITETYYGMSEEDFIKNATVLPKREKTDEEKGE